MFFDPLYLCFAAPALLLGLWAQFKISSAMKRYSQERTASGMTGAQTARRILDMNGIGDVKVEQTGGTLSDHYDPSARVLRLSAAIYAGNSVASVGVAAHEAGHAIQHATGYGALTLRTLMVPSVQIGSWLGPILFMVGLFLTSSLGTTLSWVGILLFSATVIFSLITLPVELDASKRAKELLSTSGVIYPTQVQGVNAVLDAAALTYVAAALQSLSTLLYYATILMGSRRDD